MKGPCFMSDWYNWQLLIQCCWNKFKWLLMWGPLTMWTTSFTLMIYHSKVTGLITGHQCLFWILFSKRMASWFIHSFIHLSPYLGPWAFVLTYAGVVFALAVIPSFTKPDHSLLKACLFGKLGFWLSKACSLLGTRFFECSSFTCCFWAVCMYCHAEKGIMPLPLQWGAVPTTSVPAHKLSVMNSYHWPVLQH